jgi:hypothetical protein
VVGLGEREGLEHDRDVRLDHTLNVGRRHVAPCEPGMKEPSSNRFA